MRCVAVAYSGGRDSTALLHATLQAAAGRGDLLVVALHVHHGLNAHADAWLASCEAQCARWRRRGLPVTFQARRLTSRPDRGISVEAWARQQRYAALTDMARAAGATVVLLAHHRRDQAETLLLQALRGGGTAGLSAMPAQAERDGIAWVRPWLHRPREEIEAYARRHRLRHIDDDSNADVRLARNRLRLEVWPALQSAFPQAESAFAATARWAQQAEAAIADWAREDLDAIVDARGLRVSGLDALAPPRRVHVLRAWLRRVLDMPAPSALTERLLDELPRVRVGRWPAGHAELRLYRGVLTCVSLPNAPSKAAVDERAIARIERLDASRPGAYPLAGWGGELRVDIVSTGGIAMARLAHLELRERVGSEQFQLGVGRPARSLKKQFQLLGVPAWARRGPIVYSGGMPVYVPGLGLDARAIAAAGEPQATLRWVDAQEAATTAT